MLLKATVCFLANRLLAFPKKGKAGIAFEIKPPELND